MNASQSETCRSVGQRAGREVTQELAGLAYICMSYSQDFPDNFMEVSCLLGTALIRGYTTRGTSMSTVNGALIRLILTVAHMSHSLNS